MFDWLMVVGFKAKPFLPLPFSVVNHKMAGLKKWRERSGIFDHSLPKRQKKEGTWKQVEESLGISYVNTVPGTDSTIGTFIRTSTSTGKQSNYSRRPRGPLSLVPVPASKSFPTRSVQSMRELGVQRTLSCLLLHVTKALLFAEDTM